MAALLEGQAVADIAARYEIPEGTVKSWWHRQQNADGVATVATEKKEQVGELLIRYLEANLCTQLKQLEVFGDPKWLRQQDAAEVAVLHGVLNDKAKFLLEALNNAASPD